MTKEELRKEVKNEIERMCLMGAVVAWDVVSDAKLLVEVVKEELMSDAELQARVTEGAGKIRDIDVTWSSDGGRPKVSVYLKIEPNISMVNEAELQAVKHQWDKKDYNYHCEVVDEIDLSPRKQAMYIKMQHPERTFVEFVCSGGKVMGHFLRDDSGKERFRNREVYERLLNEAVYGENGIASTMMPL